MNESKPNQALLTIPKNANPSNTNNNNKSLLIAKQPKSSTVVAVSLSPSHATSQQQDGFQPPSSRISLNTLPRSAAGQSQVNTHANNTNSNNNHGNNLIDLEEYRNSMSLKVSGNYAKVRKSSPLASQSNQTSNSNGNSNLNNSGNTNTSNSSANNPSNPTSSQASVVRKKVPAQTGSAASTYSNTNTNIHSGSGLDDSMKVIMQDYLNEHSEFLQAIGSAQSQLTNRSISATPSLNSKPTMVRTSRTAEQSVTQSQLIAATAAATSASGFEDADSMQQSNAVTAAQEMEQSTSVNVSQLPRKTLKNFSHHQQQHQLQSRPKSTCDSTNNHQNPNSSLQITGTGAGNLGSASIAGNIATSALSEQQALTAQSKPAQVRKGGAFTGSTGGAQQRVRSNTPNSKQYRVTSIGSSLTQRGQIATILNNSGDIIIDCNAVIPEEKNGILSPTPQLPLTSFRHLSNSKEVLRSKSRPRQSSIQQQQQVSQSVDYSKTNNNNNMFSTMPLRGEQLLNMNSSSTGGFINQQDASGSGYRMQSASLQLSDRNEGQDMILSSQSVMEVGESRSTGIINFIGPQTSAINQIGKKSGQQIQQQQPSILSAAAAAAAAGATGFVQGNTMNNTQGTSGNGVVSGIINVASLATGATVSQIANQNQEKMMKKISQIRSIYEKTGEKRWKSSGRGTSNGNGNNNPVAISMRESADSSSLIQSGNGQQFALNNFSGSSKSLSIVAARREKKSQQSNSQQPQQQQQGSLTARQVQRSTHLTNQGSIAISTAVAAGLSSAEDVEEIDVTEMFRIQSKLQKITAALPFSQQLSQQNQPNFSLLPTTQTQAQALQKKKPSTGIPSVSSQPNQSDRSSKQFGAFSNSNPSNSSDDTTTKLISSIDFKNQNLLQQQGSTQMNASETNNEGKIPISQQSGTSTTLQFLPIGPTTIENNNNKKQNNSKAAPIKITSKQMRSMGMASSLANSNSFNRSIDSSSISGNPVDQQDKQNSATATAGTTTTKKPISDESLGSSLKKDTSKNRLRGNSENDGDMNSIISNVNSRATVSSALSSRTTQAPISNASNLTTLKRSLSSQNHSKDTSAKKLRSSDVLQQQISSQSIAVNEITQNESDDKQAQTISVLQSVQAGTTNTSVHLSERASIMSKHPLSNLAYLPLPKIGKTTNNQPLAVVAASGVAQASPKNSDVKLVEIPTQNGGNSQSMERSNSKNSIRLRTISQHGKQSHSIQKASSEDSQDHESSLRANKENKSDKVNESGAPSLSKSQSKSATNLDKLLDPRKQLTLPVGKQAEDVFSVNDLKTFSDAAAATATSGATGTSKTQKSLPFNNSENSNKVSIQLPNQKKNEGNQEKTNSLTATNTVLRSPRRNLASLQPNQNTNTNSNQNNNNNNNQNQADFSNFLRENGDISNAKIEGNSEDGGNHTSMEEQRSLLGHLEYEQGLSFDNGVDFDSEEIEVNVELDSPDRPADEQQQKSSQGQQQHQTQADDSKIQLTPSNPGITGQYSELEHQEFIPITVTANSINSGNSDLNPPAPTQQKEHRQKAKKYQAPKETFNKNLVQVQRYPIRETEGEESVASMSRCSSINHESLSDLLQSRKFLDNEDEKANGNTNNNKNPSNAHDLPQLSPEEMLNMHIEKNRRRIVQKVNRRPHLRKQDIQMLIRDAVIFDSRGMGVKEFDVIEEIRTDPRSGELAFGRESYLLDSAPKVRYFRAIDPDTNNTCALISYGLDQWCDPAVAFEWTFMQQSQSQNSTVRGDSTGGVTQKSSGPMTTPTLSLLQKPLIYEYRPFEYYYYLHAEDFYPMDVILLSRFRERSFYSDQELVFITDSLLQGLIAFKNRDMSLNSALSVENIAFCPNSKAYKFFGLTKMITTTNSDRHPVHAQKLYAAPEVLNLFFENPKEERYSYDAFSADLYALGIALLCLKYQMIPTNRTQSFVKVRVAQCKHDVENMTSNSQNSQKELSIQLIALLLENDPKLRRENFEEVEAILSRQKAHFQLDDLNDLKLHENSNSGYPSNSGRTRNQSSSNSNQANTIGVHIPRQIQDRVQAAQNIARVYRETLQYGKAASQYLSNLEVMKQATNKISEREILHAINEIWQCLYMTQEFEDSLHYNEVFFNNVVRSNSDFEDASIAYDYLVSGKLKWTMNMKVQSSQDFDIALMYSDTLPLQKAKILILLGDFFTEDSEISAEQYFRDALDLLGMILSSSSNSNPATATATAVQSNSKFTLGSNENDRGAQENLPTDNNAENPEEEDEDPAQMLEEKNADLLKNCEYVIDKLKLKAEKQLADIEELQMRELKMKLQQFEKKAPQLPPFDCAKISLDIANQYSQQFANFVEAERYYKESLRYIALASAAKVPATEIQANNEGITGEPSGVRNKRLTKQQQQQQQPANTATANPNQKHSNNHAKISESSQTSLSSQKSAGSAKSNHPTNLTNNNNNNNNTQQSQQQAAEKLARDDLSQEVQRNLAMNYLRNNDEEQAKRIMSQILAENSSENGIRNIDNVLQLAILLEDNGYIKLSLHLYNRCFTLATNQLGPQNEFTLKLKDKIDKF